MQITFPNKATWTKHFARGLFDTGTEVFIIPMVYFNEIKNAGMVDCPELYEQSGTIIISDKHTI